MHLLILEENEIDQLAVQDVKFRYGEKMDRILQADSSRHKANWVYCRTKL